MQDFDNFKEWRSSEILKIFLLKLNLNLNIEEVKDGYFDFLVHFKDRPEVRFGIEVKSKLRFRSKLNKQVKYLSELRNDRIATYPVLIIKIDDEIEKGELDYLIFPSFKERKLLIRKTFKFIPLSQKSFEDKVKNVVKWFDFLNNVDSEEYSQEIEYRTITDQTLENDASEYLDNNFFGNTVSAYVKISTFNFSNKSDSSNKVLLPLIKIRRYLNFALSKTIKLFDYQNTVLIEEIDYPYIEWSLDSIVICKPIDTRNNQKILASILSVIITCMEVMKVALDNRLLTSGYITIGDSHINLIDSSILGTDIFKAKEVTENSLARTGIKLSEKISGLINEKMNGVNPTISDYCYRFVMRDSDNQLFLNPAVAVANFPERKEASLKIINSIRESTTDKLILSAIHSLIETIEEYDPNSIKRDIFD